jgi:PAS domain-containing protein
MCCTSTRQQASELRLRQMFEGNPGPILVYDLDTLAILDANPLPVPPSAGSVDELLEQTIDALWPPGQDQALQTKLEAIREAPEELCILRPSCSCVTARCGRWNCAPTPSAMTATTPAC